MNPATRPYRARRVLTDNDDRTVDHLPRHCNCLPCRHGLANHRVETVAGRSA